LDAEDGGFLETRMVRIAFRPSLCARLFSVRLDYTNAQWEAALRKAKQRTKAGEWPVIKSSDF
jgi:hypothetical protein